MSLMPEPQLANLYTKTYVSCPCCNGESGHTVSQLFNTGYREFGPWQCVRCRGIFKGFVDSKNLVWTNVTTVTKSESQQHGFVEQKGKNNAIIKQPDVVI